MRVVFQQAFIDRAQLFGVQGGVVDPAGRAVLFVVNQIPHCPQEITVGDGARIQIQWGEQVAVQGGDFQERGELLVGEHLPQNTEAVPDVVVVIVSAADIHQPAQPRHAVVLAVERIGTNEPAVLGDEQEKKTIDQAQQLPVEFFRSEWRMASSERYVFFTSLRSGRESDFFKRPFEGGWPSESDRIRAERYGD